MFWEILAFILGVTILARYLYPWRNSPLLPPGPKGLPLIGNLFDMPSSSEWLTYAEWGKKYNSEIVYANVAGTSIVILNSAYAAKELLEKRSAIYSSRPRLVMLTELSGWAFAFALMPYNDAWKARRRIFQKHFYPSNTDIYQPLETEYVHQLLFKLLEDPKPFLEHIRHMVGSVALSITYGIKIHTFNDPFINLAERAMTGVSESLVAGAFLVDTIPVLKYVPEWFPGATFQRKARNNRKAAKDIRCLPFIETQKEMASGSVAPSLISLSLQESNSEEYLDLLRDVGTQVYVAAADTTASSVGSFILAMVCFPDIKVKAQKELDHVLNGRLPEHNDMQSLPYLSAIVKEVLRWQVVTPMAVPHLATEDDTYNGYHIPKNSIVIGNSWAILHDEADYPDPHSFRPERFLKDDKIDPFVKDPEEAAFGFGRRMCPGRHIAQSTLWLAAGCILTCFDLRKAVDSNGQEIEPSREYRLGGIIQPLPFACIIEPRSKESEQLLRTALI
ncbi:cytochrome P450 [Crucibulum laeve]|uniref:Cytochrome P450 n=1 Tax=Crucibulum laeve TaxID=68775 RepID=A0A5C3LKP0_9AGAR|nr:cytochrome P450 [Crucibulum laeve]